jgi:MFS family permease
VNAVEADAVGVTASITTMLLTSIAATAAPIRPALITAHFPRLIPAATERENSSELIRYPSNIGGSPAAARRTTVAHVGAQGRKSVVGAALANRNLVRATLAYAASAITEWALWVGVLVYAYDHGGASAAGFASLALLLPAALVAPVAGSAADGPRPNHVLGFVCASEAIALLAAAGATATGAHPAIVVALSAIAIAADAFIRPTFAVVVPGLVTSPGELTAGNLLVGYGDSASVLVGPLVASLFIAVQGPALVFAVCGGLSTIALVLTASLVRLDPPRLTAPAPSGGPGRRPTVRLVDNARRLLEQPGSLSLLAVLGGQYVLVGGLDLLYVILAADVLRMGDSGAGYLSATFGVGAVIGGMASTVLVGRRRLAPLVLLALAGAVAALALVSATALLWLVLIALGLAGLSRSVIDLTGRILLQRYGKMYCL